MGISKAEADNMDMYVCPKCQKEETTDPIAQKPLTPPEYQHLTRLLKDLQVSLEEIYLFNNVHIG